MGKTRQKIMKIAGIVVILTIIIGGAVWAYKNSKNTKSNDNKIAKTEESNKIKPTPKSDPNKSDPNNKKVDLSEEEQKKLAEQKKEQERRQMFKDIKAKGLYLTGWTVGSMDSVKHYVELANNTEINAYVVDIKDDDGKVGYKSSIPEVISNNAWESKYDVDAVLKSFHDNNIYVIGRIVCFKDPKYSAKRPDLAIKNSSGGIWKDNHGLPWLNPYNKDSWPYLIEIAKEGIKKGFDEIQFDYVRFANDGKKSAMNFGSTTQKKHEAIDEFLAYAKKQITEVPVSADIFGIVCESPADTEDIGQNLDTVGKDVDFLSPMAYPSHYAIGQVVNGVKFSKPDFEPYGVVYNTLLKAKNRIAAVPEYKAKMRPYLQDFTASWLGSGYYMSYGSNEVRQQIKAVYDSGYSEWLIWDANNKYSESAFEKEVKQ